MNGQEVKKLLMRCMCSTAWERWLIHDDGVLETQLTDTKAVSELHVVSKNTSVPYTRN
jgi:hypothetical protein